MSCHANIVSLIHYRASRLKILFKHESLNTYNCVQCIVQPRMFAHVFTSLFCLLKPNFKPYIGLHTCSLAIDETRVQTFPILPKDPFERAHRHVFGLALLLRRYKVRNLYLFLFLNDPLSLFLFFKI